MILISGLQLFRGRKRQFVAGVKVHTVCCGDNNHYCKHNTDSLPAPLSAVMGGWGFGLAVGATNTRQRDIKRLLHRQTEPHTCRLDRSECWRRISPLSSARSSIVRQLRIGHNSLQAGTDGPVLLLESSGSTESVSAAGASRSQMGGWTGDVEL